ncbi:(S)-2-haloacid dehalogenase 4A [Lachnellula suecica]|uniref:(S)-2-haloacid dehalogenase 4A n=1 Tax=Lachnellula suecica TaxID=602035 RepID=A0A8T9CHU6_9HELO|nr:(S)-2-haloacid dehalogenase 4A [Lachnellula suecica]
MSTTSKNIVFDVVGTCVSYDNFYKAIDERLGDKLRAEGIKPKLLGFAWQEAAEREYTYLSISGAYVPFWKVFQPLFHRMLWMAGIEDPRSFATDEDSLYMVEAYKKLDKRPGIDECFKKLRDAGFTVWALTSGDTARVRGYFTSNGVDMPAENFVSCDTLGVGKPAPGAYAALLEKFGKEEKPWFAAAHTWDSSAAQRNGFKSAWCSVWEKEECVDIFGKSDVTADTLPELADKVIAASK